MPIKSPAPLPAEKISRAEIMENWALFLAVLGTIPWAIYLINDVLPQWDIRVMKLGILVFGIIIPPLMIWRLAGILVHKIYPPKNTPVNFHKKHSAASESTVSHDIGFIAGTPVHTRNGLVPIEKIRVGDWVWSKAEMGTELLCKQVTKVWEFPEQPVLAIQVILNEDRIKRLSVPDEQLATRMIIMGARQPLQTVMGGWMEAERIGRSECLVMKNEGYAYVSASAAAVLKTHNPLRGLHSTDDAPDCGWGQLIDFSRYPHVDFSQATVEFDSFEESYLPPEMWHPTYSIEVGDNDIFYVGDLHSHQSPQAQTEGLIARCAKRIGSDTN
ncbi:hypothetical protein LJR038_004448 [Acidovorax sp. LjRoot38]|uniref:hypothetical protein n=1 Tax=Acidovorax sp. LjRoot38 TaxID=3342327 RepID=UPI003ECC4867